VATDQRFGRGLVSIKYTGKQHEQPARLQGLFLSLCWLLYLSTVFSFLLILSHCVGLHMHSSHPRRWPIQFCQDYCIDREESDWKIKTKEHKER
jgi:hypothetical protein